MAVPNGDAQILAAAAAGRGEPRVGGEDGGAEYNANEGGSAEEAAEKGLGKAAETTQTRTWCTCRGRAPETEKCRVARPHTPYEIRLPTNRTTLTVYAGASTFLVKPYFIET